MNKEKNNLNNNYLNAHAIAQMVAYKSIAVASANGNGKKDLYKLAEDLKQEVLLQMCEPRNYFYDTPLIEVINQLMPADFFKSKFFKPFKRELFKSASRYIWRQSTRHRLHCNAVDYDINADEYQYNHIDIYISKAHFEELLRLYLQEINIDEQKVILNRLNGLKVTDIANELKINYSYCTKVLNKFRRFIYMYY